MPIVRRLFALWIVASLPALAEEAVQHGNFDLAIKYLDTYLTFNADNAKVHLLLGWACFKKGDHARAIEAYTTSIHLDPRDPDAYRQRAACHVARAEYDAAIRDCCDVLQLAPDHTATLRQRATLYYETKQYVETLADYEALLRLDPEDANVRIVLVDLLATCPDNKVRNLKRAEEEAGRLDPRAHASHRPYATLAAVRASRGELSQAVAWQRRALACADHLDKEEQSRAALVLKLYQTRKKKADKAALRRAGRPMPSPQGGGQ
jgi:tetratricopeptide (TPR) repeat protein